MMKIQRNNDIPTLPFKGGDIFYDITNVTPIGGSGHQQAQHLRDYARDSRPQRQLHGIASNSMLLRGLQPRALEGEQCEEERLVWI